MNMDRVLIVEDEGIVAMELENYVRGLGYGVVAVCSNAEDAWAVSIAQSIDIVLMDICIKGDTDGVKTAEEIRRIDPRTQVIFLTAHMDDYNVDRAIRLDPVAYLSKPFNREELRVCLKIAQGKRRQSRKVKWNDEVERLVLDEEFSYDQRGAQLYYCDERLHLTKKENDLLSLMIQSKNSIVDLYMIENHIWPEKNANTNTIRTLMKRVREKLKYRFIETIPSLGYRFVVSTHAKGKL
jgi:DNA-binding response OmpR family regulator